MEDILTTVLDAVSSAERALGLDWRFSYSRAKTVGRGIFEVELTSSEVKESLPAYLGELPIVRGPDGRTDVLSAGDLAVRIRLLLPDPERFLWVISSVADVRREPAHSAELLTQLIMGETAEMLKAEGDWFLARLSDGYLGWIRSWYVQETERAAVDSYGERARTLVVANVAYVRSSPDAQSLPVCDIVAGTKIIADEAERGFRRVELPGGKRGFMSEGELADGPAPVADGRRIARRTLQFIGIPYLWGGTTPKGFDCSGLVKRSYLMEGIALPRDSDRQALVGTLIPRERVEDMSTGDLLFFGEGGKVSHVAVYLGDREFIHAYGEVRINSLSESDRRYDEKLARSFLFARSVVSRKTG